MLFTLDRSSELPEQRLPFARLSNPNALISIAFKTLIHFPPRTESGRWMGLSGHCTKLVQRLIHRLCGQFSGFDLLRQTEPLVFQLVDFLATIGLCLKGFLQGGFLVFLVQGGVGE